jgi:hypothetical protein
MRTPIMSDDDLSCGKDITQQTCGRNSLNLQLLRPRLCPKEQRGPHTTFWLSIPPHPVAYPSRHIRAYLAPEHDTRRAPMDRSGAASHT